LISPPGPPEKESPAEKESPSAEPGTLPNKAAPQPSGHCAEAGLKPVAKDEATTIVSMRNHKDFIVVLRRFLERTAVWGSRCVISGNPVFCLERVVKVLFCPTVDSRLAYLRLDAVTIRSLFPVVRGYLLQKVD